MIGQLRAALRHSGTGRVCWPDQSAATTRGRYCQAVEETFLEQILAQERQVQGQGERATDRRLTASERPSDNEHQWLHRGCVWLKR